MGYEIVIFIPLRIHIAYTQTQFLMRHRARFRKGLGLFGPIPGSLP